MRDLIFLALAGSFFAVATWYVRGCAAVVGPTPSDLPAPDDLASGDAREVAT